MALFPERYDKVDACFFTFLGVVATAAVLFALVGVYAVMLNLSVYTTRSTQNGVVCITRYSNLNNTVLGVDCPRPFTNSQSGQ